MTKQIKSAVEYVRSTIPKNRWDFVWKLITTKEGLRLLNKILVGVFILLLIVILYNPEALQKLKILFWNYLLGKMK